MLKIYPINVSLCMYNGNSCIRQAWKFLLFSENLSIVVKAVAYSYDILIMEGVGNHFSWDQTEGRGSQKTKLRGVLNVRFLNGQAFIIVLDQAVTQVADIVHVLNTFLYPPNKVVHLVLVIIYLSFW